MEIDCVKAAEKIAEFIRLKFGAPGRATAVLGVSGGIDSAVVLYLAELALGPGKISALLLPYKTSDKTELSETVAMLRNRRVSYRIIDISPMVDPYFSLYFENPGPLRMGNKMARERMSILFDHAQMSNGLVLGTGNKTEILLGYTTLYGDSACAFAPIGDLYKTQVRALASHLGVPARIIEKPPTAGLWEGQTDEGELGFTYTEADRLLYQMVDNKKSKAELLAMGFDAGLIKNISARIKANAFKRAMPEIAPVTGLKAAGFIPQDMV